MPGVAGLAVGIAGVEQIQQFHLAGFGDAFVTGKQQFAGSIQRVMFVAAVAEGLVSGLCGGSRPTRCWPGAQHGTGQQLVARAATPPRTLPYRAPTGQGSPSEHRHASSTAALTANEQVL